MTNQNHPYTIGVNNDDGDCYDICIFKEGRPVATVIAPDDEIAPLVRAGNIMPLMLEALETLECALESATESGFSEDLKTVRAAIARARAIQ